jgi:hypothetical protein
MRSTGANRCQGRNCYNANRPNLPCTMLEGCTNGALDARFDNCSGATTRKGQLGAWRGPPIFVKETFFGGRLFVIMITTGQADEQPWPLSGNPLGTFSQFQMSQEAGPTGQEATGAPPVHSYLCHNRRNIRRHTPGSRTSRIRHIRHIRRISRIRRSQAWRNLDRTLRSVYRAPATC